MKKRISLCLLIIIQFGIAQVKVPQSSPHMIMKQPVGLTEVEIDYSRPSMKGRTIMGDLVPYNEIWRTGANNNTILKFSDPVKVGGENIKAGSYALYAKPGLENWTLYFYTDTDNSGIPKNWDTTKIATTLIIPVKKRATPLETFTISLDNLSNDGAIINLSWENIDIPISLEVPAKEKALKSIDKTMKKKPSARDYYSAASYYFEEKMDLNQANKWISKAVEMEDDKYWMFRLQARILGKLNEKQKAIEAAKKSLVLAQKAGNPDYVRMNKADIKAWQE